MRTVSDATIDFTHVSAVSFSFFKCQGMSCLQDLAEIYGSNSQIQAMISAELHFVD